MIRPTPDDRRKLHAAINVLDGLGERTLAQQLCRVAALRKGEQEFENLVAQLGNEMREATDVLSERTPFWAAADEQRRREGW